MIQEIDNQIVLLPLGEIRKLELFARSSEVAPEDSAIATAILDALDDMREEEILEATQIDCQEQTTEQRERFLWRLEKEIARRPECHY